MLLALVVVLYKVLDLVLNLQTILELIVLLDLKVRETQEARGLDCG